MNTIPTIGRARGLFEIFVPGVFLLLNLGVALYLLPLDRSFLSWNPSDWVSPPVFGTIVTISFGYLLGIILRVFRANFADRISALRTRHWWVGPR